MNEIVRLRLWVKGRARERARTLTRLSNSTIPDGPSRGKRQAWNASNKQTKKNRS